MASPNRNARSRLMGNKETLDLLRTYYAIPEASGAAVRTGPLSGDAA